MANKEEGDHKRLVRSSAAEYLTFVAATGSNEASVEMRYQDENIWLTQKMMATLYDVDVRTINEHLQKVFADGDLTESKATVRNFRIVQTEGQRQIARNTRHYNLYEFEKYHLVQDRLYESDFERLMQHQQDLLDKPDASNDDGEDTL